MDSNDPSLSLVLFLQVATTPNAESQMRRVPQQVTAATLGHKYDDAGKGEFCIALFCNILVGFITAFSLPFVSIVCQISAPGRPITT